MLTRRMFVAGAPFALAGCATTDSPNLTAADPRYTAMHGAVVGEPFPVAAVDLSRVDPKFYRREVAYPTREAAGTIVVDPGQRFAFLVQEGGRAIRYGVGVGKNEAFNFRGAATIARKAEWPRWVPTQQQVRPQQGRPWR